MNVPFFRCELSEREIALAVEVLRSGWFTTGARTKCFEEAFAKAVGATHATALTSCTAALHLALEALGLQQGEAVLVPTMTFAATAEVVRYFGATPVLVDCDPETLNIDLHEAERKLILAETGNLGCAPHKPMRVRGIMPVHVGGLMLEMNRVREFARKHGLWVVEDSAHAFPAAWRESAADPWQRSGEDTADVTCFSFYANKTITTGEGGMAVCRRDDLAERMRLMSLHGLSSDAWRRYTSTNRWDYRIVAPGYKYNFTDVAASIGIGQLERAEELRLSRERLAMRYYEALADVEELETPPNPPLRIHAWHLFPIRLRLDRLEIDRSQMIADLAELGVGTSVHWRPLHLHPYYEELGWRPEDCPVATAEWTRLITLPLFPAMTQAEQEHVIASLRELCRRNRRASDVSAFKVHAAGV
jgi:perosamine synthetase